MTAQQTVSHLGETVVSRRVTTPAQNRMLTIHTLPALVSLISVLLLFSGIVLILSVLKGSQLGNSLLRTNPFIPYEAIWPGQGTSSVVDFARHLQGDVSSPCYSTASENDYYSGSAENQTYDLLNLPDKKVVCVNDPGDGIFHSMNVTIDNNQVQELDLFADNLQQDTLLLYWGAPDAMTRGKNGRSLYLHWNRSTYTATAMMEQPGTAVSLVTLTATR